MDTNALVTVLVALFVGGIALFFIGLMACQPKREPKGFVIDPEILHSGRHLKVSRADEQMWGQWEQQIIDQSD